MVARDAAPVDSPYMVARVVEPVDSPYMVARDAAPVQLATNTKQNLSN
jgi:hypothetical protein